MKIEPSFISALFQAAKIDNKPGKNFWLYVRPAYTYRVTAHQADCLFELIRSSAVAAFECTRAISYE
jgi:hypothetical protein